MMQQIRQFFAPPIFEDEVKTRKAGFLRVILWNVLAVVIISAGVNPLILPQPALFEGLLALMGLLALTMLYFLQRGAVEFASMGVLSGYWLLLILAAILLGGIDTTAMNAILLVILAAGLLQNVRVVFFFASISSLATLILLIAETYALLPPLRYENNLFFAGLGLVINFQLGALFLYLANRTIQETLQKSHIAAQSLLETNQALLVSEQNYRELMELAADGIFVVNLQGQCVDVNSRGCEILGYTREELLQLSIFDVITPTDLENTPIQLTDLQAGKPVLLERELRHKNGSIVIAEVNTKMLPDGRLQAIARDITARKEVETELRLSEERFRRFIDHATDAFFLHDAQAKLVDVNRRACESLGYSREELLDKNPFELDATLNTKEYTEVQERLVMGENVTFETNHRRKDGSSFPVEVRLRLYNENGRTFAISLARDITERKKAEKERLAYLNFLENLDRVNRTIQSSTHLETMMQNVLWAVQDIFACDRAWLLYPCKPETTTWEIPIECSRPAFPMALPPGQVLYTDQEMAEMFRVVQSAERPVQLGEGGEIPLPERLVRDFQVKAQLSMLVSPKIHQPYMFGLHQCSGGRVWTNQEINLFQEIGRRLEDALTSSLVYNDLRDNERKLEEAQRIAQMGYWEINLETGAVHVSDESWRNMGLKPHISSHLNMDQWHEIWEEMIHPEDLAKVNQAIMETIREGKEFAFEYRLNLPEDETRIIFSRGGVIQESLGKPKYIFGMSQDITQFKLTQLALQEREALYRTLFEQSSDGVFLHHAITGKAIAANQAMANMLECEIDDLIGSQMTDGVIPEEMPDSIARWQQIVAEGQLAPYERRLITHKGHIRVFEITASTIYAPDSGEPGLIQVVLRDITQRKQAEEQLQSALQEKEILLKEIHHRVKNNLQVISSLLYLQSIKIFDEPTLELFRESRNRVAAMALVHEQLYQSENFAQVNFAIYIGELVNAMFDSYGIQDGQIILQIESDGTSLDVHTAIPCGLLVSEMISNALKYAFPDGKGQISISLHKKNGTIHLHVEDDGIGISISPIRPGSLGLQLIDRLTAQIGGILTRSGPPGTRYLIQFPI